MDRIEVFIDTCKRLRHHPLLKALTSRAAAKTALHLPGAVSARPPAVHNLTTISVQAVTTLNAGRNLRRRHKRIALLNFANPIEPGGGVLRGANAQEESLCRVSNLYPCLTSRAAAPYYAHHQKTGNFGAPLLGTDRVLYSPSITFFKKETPQGEIYTHRWFSADVITCAAPFFPSSSCTLPDSELSRLFHSRIRNILEVAIHHGVDALVLGAFGCGAFNNPPMLVAQAFRTVLQEPRYAHAFAEICFAIKPTGPECPNLAAFQHCFNASRG